jgi:hypothetical protein
MWGISWFGESAFCRPAGRLILHRELALCSRDRRITESRMAREDNRIACAPASVARGWLDDQAAERPPVWLRHRVSRDFARNYCRLSSLILWFARRRFDPSSSPSASQIWGAVLPGRQGAQNPADFADVFVRENSMGGFSCSRPGLENAFFSATFVPSPGSPIPNLPEAKAALSRFISNPSPSTEKPRDYRAA